MRIIEKTTVSSLERFLEEMVPRLGDRRIPVYRGQASIAQPIVPRLFRERLEETPFASWMDMEGSLMSEFKTHSVSHLRNEPISEMEWRAVGEHYGLPTRHTSWTEVGTVALYFATEPTAGNEDGVVWALLPGDDRFVLSHDYQEIPEGSWLYYPRNATDSMRNQRTVLLSHPLPELDTAPVSFEDYYQCGDERLHLYQIRIPHEHKPYLRQRLTTVGVDSRFINPGLRGLCRQIGEAVYQHSDSYEWIFDRD